MPYNGGMYRGKKKPLSYPSAFHEFSKKYVVEEDLVRKYVCQLENLQLKKVKRDESRKRLQREERNKTYDDLDWVSMKGEGKLRKLKVSFLDLYLDKHHIRCSRTTLKRDKVDIVAAHIARSLVNGADMLNDEEDDVKDEESDDEF